VCAPFVARESADRSFANSWPFRELVAIGGRLWISRLMDRCAIVGQLPVAGLNAESRTGANAFRPSAPMSRVALIPHEEVDSALLNNPFCWTCWKRDREPAHRQVQWESSRIPHAAGNVRPDGSRHFPALDERVARIADGQVDVTNTSTLKLSVLTTLYHFAAGRVGPLLAVSDEPACFAALLFFGPDRNGVRQRSRIFW